MSNCYLSDYEKWYNNVRSRITSNNKNRILFKIAYTYIPYIVALSYIILIIYSFTTMNTHDLLKIILIPAVLFIVVSFIRKIVNMPRPYTKYNIQPLINKEKKGESFPSRHTFSITIIAMAWLYVCPVIGIILCLLSIILGTVRVCAGVHFIKDVIAAALISLIFGGLGFWLL